MAQMYVEYRGNTPVAYRYGEEWVAQQLLMEGGYPTPEEAIAAWEREQVGWEASKCDTCLNSRPVISENGMHNVCGLSHKAERDCILGKKDRCVTLKRRVSDG